MTTPVRRRRQVFGDRGIARMDYYECRNCGSTTRHGNVCQPLYKQNINTPYVPPRFNKTQLAAIEDAILAIETHPDSVDMGDWVTHDRSVPPNPDGIENYCGTTACLAGHIGLALGLPPKKHIRKVDIDNAPRAKRLRLSSGHVSDIAAKVLHLSSNEQDRLFIVDDWPYRFKRNYNRAASNKGRAGAMVARLRHYVETGE